MKTIPSLKSAAPSWPRWCWPSSAAAFIPLVVFGLGQVLFHDKANGSLIVDANGTVRGSRLLGQQFTADKYFHPRPSAAGNGYDATNSGGSNLGPTSQKLRDSIAQNLADYRAQNGLADQRPRARRRRHRVRQRPGPAHQPAERRAPGPARRQGPRLEPRQGA